MALNYATPVIRNFGQDYKGVDYFLTQQDEWSTKHTGKFVLSALENTIQVWALGNAYTHGQVCGKCKVEGLILGGGDISVNDERDSIGVSGRSMDFRSLPNRVLEEYFSSFGYKIKAQMFAEGNTKGIQPSTREWFKQHGIDV
ncbi:MAG: hypothetical protein KJ583_03395 [Nanoarchaeota archaeon]|nr:hypothetical protein [Nanoarchaeota archaeon]MBU1270169.1 hypothetical protein [Nanoarchaeota archaeon]MBU1604339.1 hypothetical protein [Nanoarchaeota archaeon]MBU2443488.1 hypothetical protein [Nanoarchaeota archaeon]